MRCNALKIKKNKFNEVSILDFYKRYVEKRRFAYKIISMFSSSYQYKQLFAIINNNKFPVRSR